MGKRKLSGGAGWSLGPPSDADPVPAPARPRAARPFVRVERRAKGQVTVAGGLALDAAALVALAKEMKAACAAGGRATPDGFEVQGDHAAAVRVHLAGRGLL